MVQHYSPKDFFRRAPNVLLDRYFLERGLFVDLNIGKMKATKVAALFAAWLELPDDKRNPMISATRWKPSFVKSMR